jgi:hypothetical protein
LQPLTGPAKLAIIEQNYPETEGETMTRTSKEESSQLHSAQSLENCVVRIEQLLVVGRRVASEMARLKTGPIFIGNQPSFECAMGDLSRWGKACEDAFTIKLKEVGHFRAEGPAHAARSAAKAGRRKTRRK